MPNHLFELKPTINQQIAELERELKMRSQVYPKLIAARKLSQKAADWQVACIEAAIETLKASQQKPPQSEIEAAADEAERKRTGGYS